MFGAPSQQQANPFSVFGTQQPPATSQPNPTQPAPTNTTFGGFGNSFLSTTTTTPQPISNAFAPLQPTNPLTPQNQLNQQNNDKGQILATLNESKNIQIAILAELKTLNSKSTPITPPPGIQPGAFAISPFKTIHTGVFCNVCNKQSIQGFRYKCLFCKDFDLCEDCESKSNLHDITHPLIKIRDSNTFNHHMNVSKTPVFNTL